MGHDHTSMHAHLTSCIFRRTIWYDVVIYPLFSNHWICGVYGIVHSIHNFWPWTHRSNTVELERWYNMFFRVCSRYFINKGLFIFHFLRKKWFGCFKFVEMRIVEVDTHLIYPCRKRYCSRQLNIIPKIMIKLYRSR